ATWLQADSYGRKPDAGDRASEETHAPWRPSATTLVPCNPTICRRSGAPRHGPHLCRLGTSDGTCRMTDFSPREIVSELDRFIIGQNDAKRAVAIALRNRWRRLQLDEKLREEVMPKNILMIGPTGVGKTEISRRLARLAGAPFIKVEATKF